MFVKCPRCHSLVATDAVTGAPPDYCPYCDGPIAGHPDLAKNEPPLEESAQAVSADDTPSQEHIAEPVAAEADENTAPATIVPEDDDAAATETPAIDTAAAENDDEPAKEDATAAAESATAVTDAKPKPRKKKRTAPSFAKRPVQAPDRPTPVWFWAIAAGLALLAGLQIVLADRAQLAADARWRPLIASACAALRCALPPWHEPGAFAMLRRDVRQHPYMPGALRVDATFRNNARWAQPWPELVLTLSDVDGRALGTRAFSPQEYLDKKVTQKEIASGQSAAIRLEVMEPAAGVVSFSFDFR
ncbi:DUF3426 domain-containing protein [Luteimonas sp. SX5]|uniref:DUF3426 domain-containing protein n=1 Tax=Luteimonas galliterrae TaxID=2940486 RepID=A0ABT0ML01_9GAMM|nr:DUF3426 domain-containing protein [Luteimonas galliterrae]MCL1635565.1 DUF3426 domain-containing protein [Luteimonas galliterrae]